MFEIVDALFISAILIFLYVKYHNRFLCQNISYSILALNLTYNYDFKKQDMKNNPWLGTLFPKGLFKLGLICMAIGNLLSPIYLMWVLIDISTDLYGMFTLSYNKGHQLSPFIMPIIPGFNYPWKYSLRFLSCTLFSVLVHELGHYVSAIHERVAIKSLGIFIYFCCIPGALVTLDEGVKSLPPMRQLNVYAGGILFNLFLTLTCILLYISGSTVLWLARYIPVNGALVTHVSPNMKSFSPRQLKTGDIIATIEDMIIKPSSNIFTIVSSLHQKSPPLLMSTSLKHEALAIIQANKLSINAKFPDNTNPNIVTTAPLLLNRGVCVSLKQLQAIDFSTLTLGCCEYLFNDNNPVNSSDEPNSTCLFHVDSYNRFVHRKSQLNGNGNSSTIFRCANYFNIVQPSSNHGYFSSFHQRQQSSFYIQQQNQQATNQKFKLRQHISRILKESESINFKIDDTLTNIYDIKNGSARLGSRIFEHYYSSRTLASQQSFYDTKNYILNGTEAGTDNSPQSSVIDKQPHDNTTKPMQSSEYAHLSNLILRSTTTEWFNIDPSNNSHRNLRVRFQENMQSSSLKNENLSKLDLLNGIPEACISDSQCIAASGLDYACLRPVTHASKQLVRIYLASGELILYEGSVSSFLNSNSVLFSNYDHKYFSGKTGTEYLFLFVLSIPESIRFYLKLLIQINLSLGIVNSMPVFTFDGQFACEQFCKLLFPQNYILISNFVVTLTTAVLTADIILSSIPSFILFLFY